MSDGDCSIIMFHEGKCTGPMNPRPYLALNGNAEIADFFKHATRSLTSEACLLAKSGSCKDGGAR